MFKAHPQLVVLCLHELASRRAASTPGISVSLQSPHQNPLQNPLQNPIVVGDYQATATMGEGIRMEGVRLGSELNLPTLQLILCHLKFLAPFLRDGSVYPLFSTVISIKVRIYF